MVRIGRRPLLALASACGASAQAPFERCSGERGLVDAATWRELRSVQEMDSHGQGLGVGVDPRSDVFQSFYGVLSGLVLPDLAGAVQDCVYGVISMIFLTLPLADAQEGRDKARELLSTADALLMTYGDALAASDWPLDPVAYSQYRLLLGMQRHDCAGSPLRVYMYNSTSDMTRRRLWGGAGMMGAASHMHAFFESGSCTTSNPDEADLFFIPADHGQGYDELLRRCADPELRKEMLPYLQRRRGADHFFVVAANLPSWPDLEPLRHAVMLTVESYQVNHGIPRWYSPWKDVMIPGYIEPWRIAAMRGNNRPTEERGYTMIFHGHHPGTHGLYAEHNANVRTRILDLFSGVHDCSVGAHVPDFFARMGRSHFCLVPRGSSAWTIHLYESFFFGCIPVILSDHFEMPFQELIDWPSLSIKWPMDDIGPELLTYLRSIPLQRVAEMKRRLEEASCFFDYQSGWQPQASEAPGWSRWGGDAVARSSDCPYLGLGNAEDGAACRAACDAHGGCNAVNYHHGGGSSGGCVLRRCVDPARPALTGEAFGWELWSRAPRGSLCSPYHGIMQALRRRMQSTPFSHGQHWP